MDSPSLSNFTRRDSEFGERARSRGTTRLERKFPTSPQNKKDQTYTLFDIRANAKQYQLLTQNERRAHPNWAPTKEPKRELLEVYSQPQTGPLPGPPESYLSDLLAHKFKPNKITISVFPTYLTC